MGDVSTRNPHSLQEYQTLAKRLLPSEYWYYYDFPGPSSYTYCESIEAFKRYVFRPRLLSDVSARHLTTTVLGQRIDFPIAVAPTAHHTFANKDAEISTARGASSAGTLMIQSSFSNTAVEDVASTVPDGLRWMQIYVWKDRRITEYTIRKAEAAGYKAIVVTVDSPFWPYRSHGSNPESRRSIFDRPECRLPNMDAGTEHQEEAKKNGDKYLNHYWDIQYDASITWEVVSWIKGITSLPVVCKGILTDLAARQAADAGADGIIVSAHGGRQLDGVAAPIDVLAEVVDAVRGRGVEVYLDGGIRAGSDVFKALARGARAVFVGRPVLWGLACDGANGVEQVLHILRNELDSTMGLCGCADVNAIPSDIVVHKASYYIPKHRL